MDFWGWVLLIVVIGVVGGIAQIVAVSNKKKAMEEKLKYLPDFSPTQRIMGNNGDTGLAIDEERKKVVLIKNGPAGVDLKPITYRDVLSSEIFVDGETITKTARGSQLGGALIGGLALGGVGAIIGGLSGKTRSSEKVKRVDLRITVNDTNSPLHDINFMDIEGKKDGVIYKSAMDQARHWHGLIAVLIKIADNEDARKEGESSSGEKDVSTASLADELSKLSDLRDKGVLSEEEFSIQKQKLLS
ncbi:SHOCT domain-containing protein [uncultured Halomonas sp.]|uniref:SHOCT domain-containing protein n=1 Tax=uncultured Halomonas sp. TaxID=173971 RepID=UPI00261DB3DD|nr:SHOCT domain-containing protein [uncultured Halomonas sp.]